MNRSEAGYTILETLVAFAILASVLVALYAAGGMSLRLIGEGAQVQRATMLAQSKLDEILVQRDPLPPTTAGTFVGSNINWTIQAHDLPGRAAGISPYRLQAVRLILTWPRGSTSQSMTIETRHLGTVKP